MTDDERQHRVAALYENIMQVVKEHCMRGEVVALDSSVVVPAIGCAAGDIAWLLAQAGEPLCQQMLAQICEASHEQAEARLEHDELPQLVVLQ